MSAEIINLRLARKRRERTLKAAKASQNRAAFGQTKAAREQLTNEAERGAQRLDGHRLGSRDDDEGGPDT